MRILLVSFFFVEYVIELANALGKQNRVHLLLLENRVSQTIGRQIEQQIGPNVTCTILPYSSLKSFSMFGVLHSIIKSYIRFRPDVVHIQECGNPLNLLFLIFQFKPPVVTVHDVFLHPGKEASSITPMKLLLQNKMRKYLYRKIIVHGENLKKQIVAYHKKPAQDTFVIPHGCLFSYVRGNETVAVEESRTVLFFGRIQAYKGLRFLIEAEPLISKALPDFKIIVAGHGEDLDACKSGLLPNPHFEIHDRFIPNDEVSIFFQRAAVVVLPYIEASQSGIVAMAFAFGKPVIATNVGSIPEMVEHNVTGIIIPPKDKTALCRAIIDLLTDPGKRGLMSENAGKASLTKFSWSNIAMLTEKVYQKALNER